MRRAASARSIGALGVVLVLGVVLALGGVLVLWATEAFAGTYGGVRRDHVGFTASIDTSVGSLSNHRREGELYREKQREAEKVLDDNGPLLERMYRHFTGGSHPYKRLVARLSPSATPPSPSGERFASVEVRPPADEMGMEATKPIQMRLFLKDVAWAELSEKLAADFACSQSYPGGALTDGRGSPAKPAELEDTIGALTNERVGYQLLPLLQKAFEQRKTLAQLAALGAPLPPTSKWTPPQDARAGWVEARLLDDFFARRPLGRERLADLDSLDAERLCRAARLAALLAPDPRTLGELLKLLRSKPPLAPTAEWLQNIMRL